MVIFLPTDMLSAPLLPSMVVIVPEPEAIFMVLPLSFAFMVVMVLSFAFKLMFVEFAPAFRVAILPFAPLRLILSVPLPPLTVRPVLTPLTLRSRVLVPLPRVIVASLLAVASLSMVILLVPLPVVMLVRFSTLPPLAIFSVLLPFVNSSLSPLSLPPFAMVIVSSPEPAVNVLSVVSWPTVSVCVPVSFVVSKVIEPLPLTLTLPPSFICSFSICELASSFI